MSQMIDIHITGLDRFHSLMKVAPLTVRKWVNKAIEASIFEVEKKATDQYFRFKTPRAWRTGMLQRSFKFGIKTKDFHGEIGPTVRYAPKVHRGNPFMIRIADAAEKHIQRHFDKAADNIVKEIG